MWFYSTKLFYAPILSRVRKRTAEVECKSLYFYNCLQTKKNTKKKEEKLSIRLVHVVGFPTTKVSQHRHQFLHFVLVRRHPMGREDGRNPFVLELSRANLKFLAGDG